MRITNSRQQGFTLIEVLVAFAALALALTLLLGILSGSAREVRYSTDSARAVLHAQSLLDDLGIGQPIVPGRRDGTFENGRYRWDMQVELYRDAAIATDLSLNQNKKLYQITLTVHWGEDNNDPRQRYQVKSLRLQDTSNGMNLNG